MRVSEIQRFCMHDGPGVRTTVFLKGCPLRCAWCHNPETQKPGPEILFWQNKCVGCGACAAVCPVGAHRLTEDGHFFDRSVCKGCGKCAEVCCAGALSPSMRAMSVREVYAEIERDRAFYGTSGGMTLSGGEPLAQGDEALSLLRLCREGGIGTAIETSGFFDGDLLPALIPLTDCFLWDFKDGNDERHRQYTGALNGPVIRNLLRADELGAVTALRCIMVRGVNMEEDHYRAIADLWGRLCGCLYVELLPYHAYGGSKMTALGGRDNGRTDWIPSEDDMARAADRLRALGTNLK